jgi:hypothetical protein
MTSHTMQLAGWLAGSEQGRAGHVSFSFFFEGKAGTVCSNSAGC